MTYLSEQSRAGASSRRPDWLKDEPTPTYQTGTRLPLSMPPSSLEQLASQAMAMQYTPDPYVEKNMDELRRKIANKPVHTTQEHKKNRLIELASGIYNNYIRPTIQTVTDMFFSGRHAVASIAPLQVVSTNNLETKILKNKEPDHSVLGESILSKAYDQTAQLVTHLYNEGYNTRDIKLQALTEGHYVRNYEQVVESVAFGILNGEKYHRKNYNASIARRIGVEKLIANAYNDNASYESALQIMEQRAGGMHISKDTYRKIGKRYATGKDQPARNPTLVLEKIANEIKTGKTKYASKYNSKIAKTLGIEQRIALAYANDVKYDDVKQMLSEDAGGMKISETTYRKIGKKALANYQSAQAA